MRVGNLRSRYDILHRSILHSEGYVVENRVVEKNRLLINVADETAQRMNRKLAYIHSVNRNRTRAHVVVSRNQIHQRRFPRPRLPHEGNRLPLRHGQVYVLKNIPLPVVGEEHVPDSDAVVEALYFNRFSDLLYAVLRVENLIDPLHRSKTLRDAVACL